MHVEFRAGLRKDEWIPLVVRAQEYIAAGDIYQVNLTHTLSSPWSADPTLFYPRLCAASPAPYACFLQLGDTSVLSASPECFLRIDGRRILTRPIKGTRPRSANDEAAVRELLASPKERAELVMITDLERNDLGQVCDYGSVHVTALCELQSFAQVHHLVSTIEGRLRPEVSAVQAVRACYPGGSITGAPKKRAREIIAELEQWDTSDATACLFSTLPSGQWLCATAVPLTASGPASSPIPTPRPNTTRPCTRRRVCSLRCHDLFPPRRLALRGFAGPRRLDAGRSGGRSVRRLGTA
jgi:hypothetical protein